MDKLDVDIIEGLLLVILIDQKIISKNLRSIVVIVIEIYDYICLLYVCVGKFYCLNYNIEIEL